MPEVKATGYLDGDGGAADCELITCFPLMGSLGGASWANERCG